MKRGVIVLSLGIFCLFQAIPVAAVERGCSYKKTVRQAGTSFEITSRPAVGCAVQIVTISVHRGGKKVAATKTDVDYLVESAQAADLTGDGKPELIVMSKTAGISPNEVLDVYYLEGTVLRRAAIPEPDNKDGYKGGDRFSLVGRQIIRSVPVYRENDTEKNPTGGVRTLKYDFRDGKIFPNLQDEAVAASTGTAGEPSHHRAVSQPATGALSEPAFSSPPEITAIKLTEEGIEILADRSIEKYKTMRLDNPERIAVDFYGASSKLIGNRIEIGKFGISRVRVGLNKGFLRIVLDSAQAAFPKHTITPSKNGVIIQFSP